MIHILCYSINLRASSISQTLMTCGINESCRVWLQPDHFYNYWSVSLFMLKYFLTQQHWLK